jgi:hypothetical protein
MDVREIGWELVDWMHLAEDRNQWRTLVWMVMNLWGLRGISWLPEWLFAFQEGLCSMELFSKVNILNRLQTKLPASERLRVALYECWGFRHCKSVKLWSRNWIILRHLFLMPEILDHGGTGTLFGWNLVRLFFIINILVHTKRCVVSMNYIVIAKRRQNFANIIPDDGPSDAVILCRHCCDSTLSCQSLSCSRQQLHLHVSLATKKQERIKGRFVFLSGLRVTARSSGQTFPSHLLHFLVSLLVRWSWRDGNWSQVDQWRFSV